MVTFHSAIWCTVCALWLSACDSRMSPYRLLTPVPADPDGFSLALYQSVGVRLEPGHSVEFVNDGAIFDRLADELSRAKQSINLVLFIWRPSLPSSRLVPIITERARAGVACRILVDAAGSTNFEEAVGPELKKAGCEVRLARALEVGKLNHRNHRKIVVIDGTLGVTGGFGIDDDWMGSGRAKNEWRDSNAFVRGPAVTEMQQAFAENWQEVGGSLLPATDFPRAEASGPTRAGFVTSTPSPLLTKADRVIQLLIAAATKRVWITNPYFTPSPGLQELLIEKRRQGVDVRVLVAGDETDFKSVLREQRGSYPELLKGGVLIWEYQPTLIHTKTIVVDDQLAIIGSINLDRLSLTAMDEGALVMADPHLVEQLARAWEEDAKFSRQILR